MIMLPMRLPRSGVRAIEMTVMLLLSTELKVLRLRVLLLLLGTALTWYL